MCNFFARSSSGAVPLVMDQVSAADPTPHVQLGNEALCEARNAKKDAKGPFRSVNSVRRLGS